MKTYQHLFPEIVSFENLLEAARKAQKGKRFKHSTAIFNHNLENELLSLQRQLTARTYRHGQYTDFVIHDPKQRLISAAPYRDRVVHHALCNVIEPIFERTFIHDSYACRKTPLGPATFGLPAGNRAAGSGWTQKKDTHDSFRGIISG